MYRTLNLPYWGMYKLPLKVLLTIALLSGCTEMYVGSHIFKKGLGQYACKEEGDMKVGAPYSVDGVRYEPMISSLGYSERGVASWYGKDFHGKASANGECYNMYAYTAAHKTLPLPSVVRVTNLENNTSIVVKVNDRGPFVAGRVIDMSYAAAESLGMVGNGTAPVLIEAIGGPHHYAGGARNNTQLAAQLPNYQRSLGVTPAPTLSTSYVPPAPESEELEPVKPSPTVLEAPLTDVQTPMPPTEVAKLDDSLPPDAVALPPEPVTPPANTAPLLHTNMYVQVGAFGSTVNAEKVMDKLRTTEPTAALSKLEANGSTLTRVRSGPYGSIAEAEAALARLKAAGFDGARVAIEQR